MATACSSVIPIHTPSADPHPEQQYLALMRKVWSEGDERMDRTGVGTRSLFGALMRFDLSDDRIPLLTTKRVFWKSAAKEFLWFLQGGTNLRSLLQQNVFIWCEWPHQRYVQKTGEDIGLDEFNRRILSSEAFAARWGELGPVYGKQWTDWPTYESVGDGMYRQGQGINQVAQVVESLCANPSSRRHIVEGWNVAELDAMTLPPCHKTYQFHVADGRLNGLLYQRSCDVALGLPFNLFGAALFVRLLAQQCNLEPGELVWMGGDVHLYLNHADLVETQLAREPRGVPRLRIGRRPPTIFEYRIEDFAVEDYDPHPHIAAPVAV